MLTDTRLGFSFSDHAGLAAMLEVQGGSSSWSSSVDGTQGLRRQLLAHTAECLLAAVCGMQARRRASMLAGLVFALCVVGLLVSHFAVGAGSPARVLLSCAAAAACGFGTAAAVLISVCRTAELNALRQAAQQVQLRLRVVGRVL